MAEKVDRNCTHLAGEYFVAAELYRRGYSVAITLGNAKAIDLFAEKDTCTVNIQVKAISHRRNVGWPIMRDRVIDDVLYVFVCLNEPGIAPTYFIATGTEARAKVQQYATRGIINLTTLRNPDFLERWDKVDAALARPRPARSQVRNRGPRLRRAG
jgi:hypothetical protein